MRPRAVAPIAALAVAVTVWGAGTARAATTTLIVTGHGWGHGVGMSQWGAYGYARHGWGYRRILFHYYPGTKLSHEGEPHVRVLLSQGVDAVRIGCARRITVSDGRRFWRQLPAKTYSVGPRFLLPVHHPRGTRPFARGLAEFSCAHAPIMLGGRPYRGTLVVRRSGATVSVINGLDLDEYVRGVVPSESPARWPIAELEAQAVAARSYALAELKPSAHYDLLPDARNQVYGGMAAEQPRSNKAVEKTEGQILTYHGEVARTYYSSSSGGRTESVQDAWPGSAPIPYLRSVPDPWDTYSPNHDWGPYAYSPDQLAARLGVPGGIESARVRRNSSERASSVWLRLSSGRAVNLSGVGIASSLGLRSTWFSIGELSLSTSTWRVLYGRPVRIVARAVETTPAVLEEKGLDGVWRTLHHVEGSRSVFSVVPHASTAFRLRIAGASSAGVDVAVRPQLRVAPLGPHMLGGEVVPRTAGPVKVWRRERGVWRVVSRPHVLRSGKFRSLLRLRPAVYRITAGDGAFAPALRRLVITRRILSSLTQ
jgi:stage II sporulation protein D